MRVCVSVCLCVCVCLNNFRVQWGAQGLSQGSILPISGYDVRVQWGPRHKNNNLAETDKWSQDSVNDNISKAIFSKQMH